MVLDTTDLWTITLAVLCAVACAIPGTFLVLRRQSMLADAVSHTVLPGIVAAYLLSGSLRGWPVFLGAVGCGLVTALLSDWVQRSGRMAAGSALGVVFTALFALGLILVRLVPGLHLDVNCVLAGELEIAAFTLVPWLGLEVPPDLPGLLGVLLLDVAVIALLYKELKLVAFDPDLARTQGLPVWFLHGLTVALVAVTAVAAFRAVGVVMVVALVVVPAASAWLWCQRLLPLLLLSAGLAALAAVAGFFLALLPPVVEIHGRPLGETSMAAAVAVATGVLFAISHLFAPEQGLVARWWRRHRLRVQSRCEDVLGFLYRVEELPSERRPMPEHGLLRRALGVGRWALAQALAQGRRRGLVQTVAGQVALTEAGRAAAQRLVRAHRLWELYLQQHFGFAADHVHPTADRLEHLDDQVLAEQLRSDLGDPGTDPHGRAVP